ncbi:unnamed protein product [Rotaria sordida]|uniref:U-box domain-containing protein n=1 Tax=Rotaria sordida TaxID=392033 RepID=A0A814HWM4_9BILA|nr:unnamed protein product [Rotaria sordida]CAF1135605.1 unnamed protein product [Rotaria sordida]CAF3755248.1 unnamed protein product [Rotaria sordida]CAF3860936.1 unnamed protein product [Rotaria sordida]
MAQPSETFICPITHELMRDPVIDPDGNSYERQAIEGWLRQNGTSPITRTPLSASDLRPNRALKAAIDEYRKSLKSNDQGNSSPLTELKPSELTVSGIYSDSFVHIKIQPPPDTNRSPCDVCCVVDTSGSMAVQAEIQNDANEKFGLSQLDLVKHAIKTIIHSLEPQDRLSLVSFANSATVLFQLTKMDQDGKSSALAALERLEDNGQTNLWDGLRTGLDILAKGQRAVGSNSALFLLTDGCPNIEPPRGYLPTLEKLKKKTHFTCTINTFGFGYELDSKLLEDIAILGNAGTYAFIPDGSFVGTIFVNAMATLLATVATNVQICVHGQKIEPSDYTRWYSTVITGHDTVFELGSITFGQSKDLLIPLSYQSFQNCNFTLVYDTLLEKKKSIKFNINTSPQQTDLHLLAQHKFRLQFVQCVRTALEAMRPLRNDLTTTNEQSEAAMNRLKQLEEEMKIYSDKNDQFVKDLLTDLTGQIQEALANKDWFKKWGIHFLPSITRAHLLQYCNNFKDPGVQNYGQGNLFSTIRDEMDTIFCALPAPKPSQQTGAPIDMSVFYNASGGCFYGGCTVRLMNGTTKLIKHVQPGDRIAPHGGMVNYVVKTKCQNKKAKMVVLDNGLIITAWHPIRVNQQWIMPCSLVSAPTEISCEEVYNFALDQGHTMFVNDIECVTLGHGFKDDVVRHAYYGTQRVIEDLHQLDYEQNNTGIIEITQNTLIRNKKTGLVSGLRLIDGQYQQQISVQ